MGKKTPPELRLTHRPLGKTGLRVSPLGLSGSFGIRAGDVERAFEEHGINYFFITPRMKGMVEGVKRLLRAGHRDRIVLASGAAIPTGGSVPREWGKTARVLAGPLAPDRLDEVRLFGDAVRSSTSSRFSFFGR